MEVHRQIKRLIANKATAAANAARTSAVALGATAFGRATMLHSLGRAVKTPATRAAPAAVPVTPTPCPPVQSPAATTESPIAGEATPSSLTTTPEGIVIALRPDPMSASDVPTEQPASLSTQPECLVGAGPRRGGCTEWVAHTHCCARAHRTRTTCVVSRCHTPSTIS